MWPVGVVVAFVLLVALALLAAPSLLAARAPPAAGGWRADNLAEAVGATYSDLAQRAP